jgi:hypothetical protein
MTDEVLAWLAYGGAILAVLVYFWAWLRRPAAIRLLNNAGLFFTGLGLLFVPLFMPRDYAQADRYAVFSVVFLLLALAAQILAAFRERRAWDGLDRRERKAWDGVDRRGRAWDGVDRRNSTEPEEKP